MTIKTTRRVAITAASLAFALLSGTAYAATINGTPGNDTLNGTSAGDYIYGKGGDDHITPKGGHDYAYGGAGDDVLSDFWRADGSDPVARDWFYGGIGADTIYASARDQVWGGAGNDKVVLAYAGAGTLVDCGRGFDRLVSNQPLVGVTRRNCERVRIVSAG